MIKFAVIGDPIAHSLSPAMQNAGIKALGLDAEYFAEHVRRDDLKEFTEQARRGLAGFNITVPHKNAIFPFLDHISKEAQVAGSVNTVTVKSGRLYGDTTDGYGLAAHAAAAYFASKGTRTLHLINRTVAKADELAEKLRTAYGTDARTCAIDDHARISEFLNTSDVVIQCTSLGLKPDDPAPIDLSLLPQSIKVYDTIYKKTPIVRECERRGIPFANGLAMLLHQGARSLELWTGRPAPVEIMRAALNKAYAEKQ